MRKSLSDCGVVCTHSLSTCKTSPFPIVLRLSVCEGRAQRWSAGRKSSVGACPCQSVCVAYLFASHIPPFSFRLSIILALFCGICFSRSNVCRISPISLLRGRFYGTINAVAHIHIFAGDLLVFRYQQYARPTQRKTHLIPIQIISPFYNCNLLSNATNSIQNRNVCAIAAIRHFWPMTLWLVTIRTGLRSERKNTS